MLLSPRVVEWHQRYYKTSIEQLRKHCKHFHSSSGTIQCTPDSHSPCLPGSIGWPRYSWGTEGMRAGVALRPGGSICRSKYIKSSSLVLVPQDSVRQLGRRQINWNISSWKRVNWSTPYMKNTHTGKPSRIFRLPSRRVVISLFRLAVVRKSSQDGTRMCANSN